MKRLAAVLALLVLVTLPTGARAQPAGANGQYLLSYRVSFTGLPIARANIAAEYGADDYSGVLDIRTTGLARLLTRWAYRAETIGRRDGDALLPDRHVIVSERRDDIRRVDIFFGPGGATRIATDPPPSLDADRSPLTDDMRDGTVDLITALMTIFQVNGAASPCTGPLPIHDGYHRFNLLMAPAPGRRLDLGDTVGCSLSVEPIGGFKTNDDNLDFNRTFETWFADPLGVGLQMIVELESDLAFGHATVRLTEIEDFEGRRLWRR